MFYAISNKQGSFKDETSRRLSRILLLMVCGRFYCLLVVKKNFFFQLQLVLCFQIVSKVNSYFCFEMEKCNPKRNFKTFHYICNSFSGLYYIWYYMLINYGSMLFSIALCFINMNTCKSSCSNSFEFIVKTNF